ncbi:hypothetical protein B0H63DRAFT_517358 [Podospora didyma]|uniref:RBR-type E3 ubiquitin transferase n=1 Tax=Podospora didyma TaxID=330526 RepID=A0AAE0P6G9_9PEZI|nr:hypothetical protein B0H63DRAFT_517358 [Podospora didyma]
MATATQQLYSPNRWEDEAVAYEARIGQIEIEPEPETPVEFTFEGGSEAGSAETEEHDEPNLSQFAPPKVLTSFLDNTDKTLVLVVQKALANIIEQVDAEKQQAEEAAAAAIVAAQQAEDARKAEAEAEALQGKGKAPAVDREDDGSIISIPRIEINGEAADAPAQRGTRPNRPPKRSRFGFRRIFHHIVEKGETRGESSTHGASQHHHHHHHHQQYQYTQYGWETPSSDTPTTTAATGPASIGQLFSKHIRPSTATDSVGEATEPTVECVSCLEDIRPKDAIKTVCHYYCKECFERLIAVTLETEAQWPPKCCLNPISYRVISKNLSRDLLTQYRQKDEEYKIPVQNRIYCSEPDCGEWIRKVNKARKTARCSKGHEMCVMCRQPPHAELDACPQDNDRHLTDQLAEEEGWRRCIRCNILVEHREACQHMTCRCGAEFCYVCGAAWPTCSCNMEQLNEIKQRAAARRQEREEREAADNEWLQKALQLIEELEREERRKADEVRAIEAAERARREEARLIELEAKFEELRISLTELDDLQRTMLSSVHDSEILACEARAVEARQELAIKQGTERAALRASTAAEIARCELEWENDYQTRAVWEKQLEQEYATALHMFWADKVGGHQRIDLAMRAYMRKNDERMEAWHKWRDDEREKFRFVAKDELEIREELLDAARQRHEEVLAARETDLMRRYMAERKWFDLVVAERARLLTEMEVAEREAGKEEILGSLEEKETGVIPLEGWSDEMLYVEMC